MSCLRGGEKYGYARRGKRLLKRKENSAAPKEVGKAICKKEKKDGFQRGRGERLLNRKETSAAPKEVGKADFARRKRSMAFKEEDGRAVGGKNYIYKERGGSVHE